MQKTTTFLMFVGKQFGRAEEAIRFYTSLFRDSEIVELTYFKANEPGGTEGAVKLGRFRLAGEEYIANDSNGPHPFTFTPAISIFVSCEDEAELKMLLEKLGDGGQTLMPLNDYGFSKLFAWVADRYGISWQLNLA